MKLLYIVSNYINNSDSSRIYTGIEKKLLSETECLRELNVDIELIGRQHAPMGLRGKIDIISSAYRAYRGACATYTESDCIYFRGVPSYLGCLFFHLKRAKPKIVIELNGSEKDDYLVGSQRSLKYKIYYSYLLLSLQLLERNIKSQADAIVSVTDEISEHNKLITNGDLRYLTLGNGIDTSSVHVRSVPKYENELHVMIVAYLSPWHAVDRFIKGLSQKENNTKIVLHIIGEGSVLFSLKELTNNLNINNSVIFHGVMTGKDLDDMFNKCHIALGSLGGSRIALTEFSSLKSREYCARGIPFLMASKDADFPDDFPYIQKVPADESPIDMNTVISFAERIMNDPEHSQKMRAYAEGHLDWMAKMKILKEFIESV